MNFLEIAGLGSCLKSPDDFVVLMDLIDGNGEKLSGYSGWYGFCSFNGVDCILHVEKNEIIGFSFHMKDGNRWKLSVAGEEEFSQPPHDRLSRGRYFGAKGDRKKVPIMLIKSDVLPSLMPGDEVEMQVAAAAVKISYYPDEEAWAKKNNLSSMGEMFSLVGNVIGWVDGASIIKGIVKGFSAKENMPISVKEERTVTCRCLVETGYGDIAVYHTEDMVEEDERRFMKEGACVLAQCIIQGDVALGPYGNGAVYDKENILKLLRECFHVFDFTRARGAFASKAKFIDGDLGEVRSRSTAKTIKILQQMAETAGDKEEPFFTYPATVKVYFGSGEDGLTGCRVLALARETPAYFREMICLDLNGNGRVTAVSIKNIDDYMVEIDESDRIPRTMADCLVLIKDCLNDRDCSRLINYLAYDATYTDSEDSSCEGCYEVLDALEGLLGYDKNEECADMKAFLVKLDEGTEAERLGVGVSFSDYDECSGVLFIGMEGGYITSAEFVENDFILEGLEEEGEHLPADALEGSREWLNFMKRWAGEKKVEPMDLYVAMDPFCRLAVDDGKVIDVIRERDAVFARLREIIGRAGPCEVKGDRLLAKGFSLTVKSDSQGRITLFKITLEKGEEKK